MAINQHMQDWLDELRSGNRTQGTGCMRRDTEQDDEGNAVASEYCCMGVACDMAGVEFVELVEDTSARMPGWLNDALGLHESENEDLASFNDDKRYTFEQIADIVEYSRTHDVSLDQAAGVVIEGHIVTEEDDD